MTDFSNYKTVRLSDIADIERAKRGKVYPVGCTLIELSATSERIRYLEAEEEVDARYAVIISHYAHEPKYIYYSIQRAFPRFLHEWKTGLNLKFENLQYLSIAVHPIEVQREIVKEIRVVEQKQEKEEKQIAFFKELKKSFLNDMFCS